MKRGYGDRCGIARALDVVGERWALLVVRELVLGPKRFSDLQRGLPHVGPDMLAQRLRDLEDAGLVRRTTLAPPGAAKVYELTERGHDLEPVLQALGRFGSRQPITERETLFGPDAAAVALPTTFDPARAAGVSLTVGLRMPEEYVVRVADAAVSVTKEDSSVADVTIEASPGVLGALLWHGRPLRDAVVSGDAEVTGPRRTAERFLKLFPLPPAAV